MLGTARYDVPICLMICLTIIVIVVVVIIITIISMIVTIIVVITIIVIIIIIIRTARHAYTIIYYTLLIWYTIICYTILWYAKIDNVFRIMLFLVQQNMTPTRPFVILRIVRPRILESKLWNHCAKKLDGALRKPTSFV